MKLTFSVGGAVKTSSNLVDPLAGTVYGEIFRTADVGATGPRDGAEQFGDVVVQNVDLTQAAVSSASWTSDPLPPDSYTFLGYFDVDGSTAANGDRNPEMGDPVTLPTVNKVTVDAAGEADLEVEFDLVL